MTGSAGLMIAALRKQFGETAAVDGIDLEIKPGEFLSLLGPSGSGKTTVLRIVAGFEEPDSGSVLVNGSPIDNTPAHKRNMGMVFQAYSLFPTMTARQNIEFGLRLRGMSKRERADKANEALELVRLSSHGDRYAHQLSGGEQQRVALARALALEPSVLLLDEPLSALDAKVRLHLRDEIRAIQSRLGITTLYVTHDQEEALAISDRIAVMSTGRVQQVGTPAEIYSEPASSFVAEFVGTTNRLDCRVCDDEAIAFDSNGTRLVLGRHALQKDTLMIALIRPEGISITPGNGNSGDESLVAAAIRRHTFLGATTRLELESPLGVLLADVPSAEAVSLPLGSEVLLRLDASAVRLLPRP
ncbi:MAG TPA: ABC transporter ATP-binding protein [Gaiellaceae bacterium]|nr:ABC transporter ATP-binding protein [Gaiellaceae bacterium]